MCKDNAISRRLSVHQGDIILVNFGHRADRKTDDIHPALVISSNQILSSERMINVIPLYRRPSQACRLEDIRLVQTDCIGLKYTMYVQPLQLKMINCYQIKEVIGSVTDKDLMNRILNEVVRTIIEQ